MKDTEGTSNLSSNTKAECPSTFNSKSFSIDGGCKFTAKFTVEEDDVNDKDSIGLIQIITESDRTLENAKFIQRSYFPDGFPALDGDVSTDDTLWYRPASAKELKSAGVMELSLPDNPTTAPAEDSISGKSFIGPPTAPNISEGFFIILAKRSRDQYTKLDAWSWPCSDFFFFFTVGALCLIPTKCKGFFKESLTPKEGQHLLWPFSYHLLYCHTCPISR